MKHLNRLWIFGFALLGACGSAPPVPEDRYYRLPEVQAHAALAQPVADYTVSVMRPRSEGLYNERALLYVEAEHPLEVRRYHYHYWINSPTSLIQEHLLSYLRAVGFATKLVRYQPGARAEARIRGKLLRFEQIIEPAAAHVLVVMELQMTRSGEARPARRYEATAPAASDSVHDAVIAFGRALEQIYGAFVRDQQAAP